MHQYNILFLCTHNSSRSILGEALASTHKSGRFLGYSAGSTPGKNINPIAEELALEMGYPQAKMYSKSWDEFAKPDAPQMDFIITVCDSAAHEACPIWIGHPATAHWGFPDPSKVEGSYDDKRKAFEAVMKGLKQKIDAFASLQLEKLDHASIENELRKLVSI
jgi:arsenate reductase (thioredoxin)